MLITTFDIGRLMDVLAEDLPSLNTPSAYLSLYEDPHDRPIACRQKIIELSPVSP